MAGPIYFAWIGGITYPAFTLITTGDTWGGSLQTYANVWGGEVRTKGTIAKDSAIVSDLDNVDSLIIGQSYDVSGTGIVEGTVGTYSGGTDLMLNIAATEDGVGAEILLSNQDTTNVITGILDTSGLIVADTYGVAGAGIASSTTCVYDGGTSVTLSTGATATAAGAQITFTKSTGRNILANLADISGLVVGQTYSVFGAGVTAGSFFTYEGGTSVTLTTGATKTKIGSRITVRKGVTEDDGGAFDASIHAREDEDIAELDISQLEGDFATLAIDVRNPKIVLLSAGRNLWCWLSWNNGTAIVPLFHGRLVGIPQNIDREVVRLQFIARPADFFFQKSTLAETLKAPPYFDPIWLQSRLEDPNTVLEARTELWHIDRITLEVTTSDFLSGEDSTIEIDESQAAYASVAVTYGQAPLRTVNVLDTVTWHQTASGTIDLTDKLVGAFQDAGSPFAWPLVGSYTAGGLLSSWPAENTTIGGGWTVSQNSLAVDATSWQRAYTYSVKYADKPETATTLFQNPSLNLTKDTLQSGYKNWDATFTLGPISVTLEVRYDADRARSETVIFNVSADVQSIGTDPGAAEEETISVSADVIDQPVDDGGELPIGDPARYAYFPTDWGQQSLRYLMLLARAKLVSRSRAVNIKFETGWEGVADAISCRHNALFHDDRLPGGQALGKVISYSLRYGRSAIAEITIGCSIGYGNVLPTAAEGRGCLCRGLRRRLHRKPGFADRCARGRTAIREFRRDLRHR